MVVPVTKTELGKKAFKYAAPSACNDVQEDLKLSELITLAKFNTFLKDREKQFSWSSQLPVKCEIVTSFELSA